MQDYEMKKVSINSLLLSNNNPRLDASFEEYEAMLKMIGNQKDNCVCWLQILQNMG